MKYNYKLISFDVDSLFTNSPVELALKYIHYHFHVLDTSIPKHIVIFLIEFTFNSSILCFICSYIYLSSCPINISFFLYLNKASRSKSKQVCSSDRTFSSILFYVSTLMLVSSSGQNLKKLFYKT